MNYYLIYDKEYKIIKLSSQREEMSVFVNNLEDIRITNKSYFDIKNNTIVTENKIYKIDNNKKNDSEIDVDLI